LKDSVAEVNMTVTFALQKSEIDVSRWKKLMMPFC